MKSVFSYTSYRSFLLDVTAKFAEDGISYRALSRKWGVGGPNYIQQILANKRNLTVESAKKIGEALVMSEVEASFLVDLVKLDSSRYKDKSRILEHMRSMARAGTAKQQRDPSIHSSWLHGVVLELAALTNLDLSPAGLKAKIRVNASEQDIEESLKFLVKQGYLEPGPNNGYIRREVRLEALDDVRRIDIQRSHLHFLDIAKHRLNDDLDEREYRGLTVAIAKNFLPQIKERLRTFFTEIRKEIAVVEGPKDTVVRLQCALFKLTND